MVTTVIRWPPADAHEALARVDVVTAAVAGTGAPLCPDPDRLPDAPIPDGTALMISTSGSTGTPKFAALGGDALRASVHGVDTTLGGPGQWMVSVPVQHISGFQSMLRSLLAGHTPAPIPAGPFTPASFTAGAAAMDPGAPRRYTTLVPTQLVRVLDDPEAVEAARTFDVIVIGGAPLARVVTDRARALGVTVCTGYGASEMAGGVLYDGRPLPGTEVRLDADGRILVAGDVLAAGYVGRPEWTAAAFPTVDGRRHYRTDDLGRLEEDGTVTVLGRVDDLINTGGLKVAPRVVEEAIADAWDAVADVVVLGVSDDEWGEAVTAVLSLRPGRGIPPLPEFRAALHLPAHARPRAVVVLDALPCRGPGKIDRRACRTLAERHR